MTCGTTDIPHGYSACYSIFDLDPKSIYTGPRKSHWDAAIRILKYIKGSPGQGLSLPSENNLTLTTYWGGCQTTQRSVSRYCNFLGSSIISWKSKRQTTNVSKIISGRRIPRDGQYLFGDSLVAIFVT